MNESHDFWMQAALDLENARILLGLDFRVLIESQDDISFWKHILSETLPDRNFDFIPGSLNQKGNIEKGKKHCLNYVGGLSPHLIAAVDSDFDYLLGNSVLSPSNFILQTYTYSMENHYIYAPSLQSQWKKSIESQFDFHCFILSLSRILFRPLVSFLMYFDKSSDTFTLKDLRNILMTIPKRVSDLDNNGESLLRLIEQAFHQIPIFSDDCNESDLCSVQHLSELGLKPDTAYLFWRGHDMEDLLIQIGQLLSQHKLDFKNDVIRSSLNEGYSSMLYKQIVHDICCILG